MISTVVHATQKKVRGLKEGKLCSRWSVRNLAGNPGTDVQYTARTMRLKARHGLELEVRMWNHLLRGDD